MSVRWIKYGTQSDIRFSMVKRGVVDLAVSADWTPAAADSAISKDGGNLADTTNTVAVVSSGTATRGSVDWKLTISATEAQAAEINIQIVDAATKAVEDQFLTVYTYGNASAKFAGDWSDIVRLGLTAIPNVASGSAGALLVDGTGTAAISNSAGKVLLQATQSGVTIPTVTTVTNQLTAAAIATGVWTDTTAGDFTTALSVGKSVMNGVALGTGLTVAAVSGAVGSVTGAVGSVTGNVGGSVASVTAAVTLTAAYDAAKTASQAGDAMALTGGERTTLAGVINTTAIVESYRANGAVPTPAQFMSEVLAHLGESSISGTTKTLKKLDHSTTAETFTLDSATTPAAVTRAT